MNVIKNMLNLSYYRIKYLKIIVKRPVVSFIQGSYSPMNGKAFNNVGSSITFLSIIGEGYQKRKLDLLNIYREVEKVSSLTILGNLINEENQNTVKKIAECQNFVENLKNNFCAIEECMVNYSNIVPNIIYYLGSNNEELGDWIIDKFFMDGHSEIKAKLINRIILSCRNAMFNRINRFLKNILKKIENIVKQLDIESNVKLNELMYLIESFCKTL